MMRKSLVLLVAAAAGLVGCGDGEEGSNRGDGGTGATTTGGESAGGAETGGAGATNPSGGSGGTETGGEAGSESGGTGGDDLGGTGGGAGAPLGGTSTGGSAGGAGGPACTASFWDPGDGAQLDETDDVSGDLCADGFQYDVRVTTDARAGTPAVLYAGSQRLGDAVVSGQIAEFVSVQLDANRTTELQVVVGEDDQSCGATAEVAVLCAGVPTCEISAPELTDTHPLLNGVPVADGGDRVSSAGSAYQVRFEVATNVTNGQPVSLHVEGMSSALTVNAVDGSAVFPGVTLVPDGDYAISATCEAVSGATGSSASVIYGVDTAPPAVTVYKTKVDAGDAVVSLLLDGDHFDPEDDADPSMDDLQIEICGTTTATDAIDLPSSLGARQSNFCAQIGSGTAICSPVVTSGASEGDGGCVEITCPGEGAFDLSLTLTDEAGNPTTEVVQGLTCASSRPQVAFLDPVSDAPAFDVQARRILAASAPDGQRKDQDANLAGAQYDVSVCTTASAGTARLLGARQGSTLQTLGTGTVAADTAGSCPVGFPGIIVFSDATLPESGEDAATFELSTPTQLVAEVTNSSSATGTGEVLVWVDSTAPTLRVNSPSPFCGATIDSNTDVTRDVRFVSSVAPVSMLVGSTPYTGDEVSLAFVTIEGVLLTTGQNEVSASVVEPAGNVGELQQPCVVTVGDTPSVVWQSPDDDALLGAVGNTVAGVLVDGDGGQDGWQGQLEVCSDVDLQANPDATIEIVSSVDGSLSGGPQPLTSACYQLDVTLTESPTNVLTATISPGGTGFDGVASITTNVDVVVPAAPTDLAAEVLVRRNTSFLLTWTAPDDGGKAPESYDVRVAEQNPITNATDFANADRVTFSGVPAAPGQPDSVEIAGRMIETDQYFAVVAVDGVGNRSSMVATTDAARGELYELTIPSPATGACFGSSIDGTSDLNKDGVSDLVVGSLTGTEAYVYFGPAPEPPATWTPAVTFTGDSLFFGQAARVVGDVDGDGNDDIAIGSYADGDGKVFVYYGHGEDTWPTPIDQTEADAVIQADSSGSPAYVGGRLGFSIARLGNFDGDEDGLADFAIGIPYYTPGAFAGVGQVAIVLGKYGGIDSTITLPGDFGADVLRIDGDPAFGDGALGWSVYGAGDGWSPSTPGVVAGAPYAGTSYAGMLYPFPGQSPAGGVIALSSADGPRAGSANSVLGFGELHGLGALGPGGRPAYSAMVNGPAVLVFSGTSASGPVADLAVTINGPGSAFGKYNVGGAMPGGLASLSLFGSQRPDVVVGAAKPTPRLFFFDGDQLAGASSGSTLDAATDAVITHRLAGTWSDFSGRTTLLVDINDDDYPDVGVGEYVVGATAVDGKVAIVY